MKKTLVLLSTAFLASCAFEQKPAPYEANNTEFYGKNNSRSGYASGDIIAPAKKRADSRYGVEGYNNAPAKVAASSIDEDDYNSKIDAQNSNNVLRKPLGTTVKTNTGGEVYSHQSNLTSTTITKTPVNSSAAIDGDEDTVKIGAKPLAPVAQNPDSLHSGNSTTINTAYDLKRQQTNLVAKEETVPPVNEKPGYLNVEKVNEERKAEDKLAKIKPIEKPEYEEPVETAQTQAIKSKPVVETAPVAEAAPVVETETAAEAKKITPKIQKIETSSGTIEKSTIGMMNKQEAADEEESDTLAMPAPKAAVQSDTKAVMKTENGVQTVSKVPVKEEVPPVVVKETPVVKEVPAAKEVAEEPAEKPKTTSATIINTEKKISDIKPADAKSAPQFIKPVDGVVVSEFGSDKKDGGFNDGINIQAPEGTPVKAASGGTVVYSGNQLAGYGNLIIIRHNNGYLSAYSHLKELELKKGEAISQGDIVGHVGKTGNVESPQLHFGIRKGREPVDPKDYI